MAAARYFDLVREMKSAYNHRLRLVESARDRGIKPAARLFSTTVLTVRKWLHRYHQQGRSGLVSLSRAPRHQSRRTPVYIERQVVALRQTPPTFGATPRLTPHPVHRPRGSQWAAVLIFRLVPKCDLQRSFRFASSSTWLAMASRCMIWSGKPTTAASSKATSPPPRQ